MKRLALLILCTALSVEAWAAGASRIVLSARDLERKPLKGLRFANENDGVPTEETNVFGITTLQISASLKPGDKVTLVLMPSQRKSEDWFLIDPEINIPSPNSSANLVLMRRRAARKLGYFISAVPYQTEEDRQRSLRDSAARLGLSSAQLGSAIRSLGQGGDLHDRALAAFLEGDDSRVEEVIREVPAAELVSHVDGLRYLGALQLQQARYQEAAVTFAVAVGLEAQDASLQGLLGVALYHSASWSSAESALRRALSLTGQGAETDPGAEARLLNYLAQLRLATNRLTEVEPLLLRALALDERHFGPRHPNVARDLNNLAQFLLTTNRLTEAETRIRRALSIDESSLGIKHPAVARDLNTLGRLLLTTNRLAEAEPLLRRALSIDESSLGLEHPNVARDLNRLGEVLMTTNRMAEAEPLLRRALTIDTNSLGPEHPAVARDLASLAQMLFQTDRISEGGPLAARAFTINQESFGPDHPSVARDLSNLARLLLIGGQEVVEDTLVQPVVGAALRILTPSHLLDGLVVSAGGLIGARMPRWQKREVVLWLYRDKTWALAEPLLRQALAIDQKSLGREHPIVALDLNNLASLLLTFGRLDEAEDLLNSALVIDQRSFGPEHAAVARDLINLSEVLLVAKRGSEAESGLRRALAIDEASYGTDHPNVARDLRGLARLLLESNRLEEAEGLLRRALAIDEGSFGRIHPNVARDLSDLSLVLQASGRLAEAETLLRQALVIDGQRLGGEHPDLVRDLSRLAMLLKDTRRFAEAEPLLRRVLDGNEKRLGLEHLAVAGDLRSLSLMLQASDRLAEAELLMRRSLLVLSVYKQRTGHVHPDWSSTSLYYSSILRMLGKSDDEIETAFKRLKSFSR